ncbi:MurR/RpiR family transcriptional regulator [Salisediminibacterium halotolerans]|uniref:MurR/RpiR family transcriptional regulator n=2 Tax=Salisediminibacterium halotolerans TaxID=517425 RepID=UPI001F54DC55|nr:MurR/RpiR family transcriptional regulator [Salisediminibacterium halotolerans]
MTRNGVIAMAKTMLLTRMEEQYNQFTSAEKKVADYVLEQPEFISTMTTKDLAARANASQASIVRFCKRLGIESFPKLKLTLAQELTQKDTYINSASLLEWDDSSYMLFQKVSSLNEMTLNMGTKTLNSKVFEAAAASLAAAEKVVFFGVGGSYTSCIDGQYKFMRLGYNSLASADFHQVIPFLTMMRPGDAVVCVSNSGKTKEVVELAEYAKKQGVQIIALTAGGTSKLQKLADYTLLLPNVEVEQRIGSIASRTSQLNMIDALYVSIFHQIGDNLLTSFNQARGIARGERNPE